MRLWAGRESINKQPLLYKWNRRVARFDARFEITLVVPRVLTGAYCGAVTGFRSTASGDIPWPAMKKLWSYMSRYMRPEISAAFGPKVGRPPSRNTTTTMRPILVFA